MENEMELGFNLLWHLAALGLGFSFVFRGVRIWVGGSGLRM